MQCYVEYGVDMAFDHGSAAWSFDLRHWGCCGQGIDESSALADLRRRTGSGSVVVERIRGDERAFVRDRRPATDGERAATLTVLATVRPRTIALIESCPDSILDADHPDRVLPAFARWRTLRQMAWHIADTESRYYLPMVGLRTRPRAEELLDELRASHSHVMAAAATLPPDIDVITDDVEWTTVKLLRRLAWHERGELEAMAALAARLTDGD